MGDAMARPHQAWKQDPYAPRQGGYYAQEPARERVQLPGPSTLFTAVNHSPVPAARDAPPYSARPSYYGDYATPSPVGQTPPQFPAPNSDPHPTSGSVVPRRTVDARLSPTQSTVSSGSDDVDLAARHHIKGPPAPGVAPLPPRLPNGVRYRSREPQPPPDNNMSKPPQGYPTPNGKSAYPHQPASPPLHPGASPRAESKQMSITSLLADDTPASSRPEASTNPKAPVMPSPARSTTSEYSIRVRQQPVAARSCGFGERDRRVIDPPPIVQLIIDDPDASKEEIGKRIRHPFSVVHCSIWNETGEQDNSAMPEDYRQQRRLMGTLVASPFVGLDEDNNEGCFFCFPDLSCRTPGSFRLKFSLVVLNPLRMLPGAATPIVATAMSEVFTVYNAKDFPGMSASTSLTKRLKDQGCLISIKKGNEKTSASHGRDDDSDDDAEEGSSSQKGRKRQKKS